MAPRKSNKKRNVGGEQMADAGGGSPYQFFGTTGPNAMNYNLQRPDFRGQSGLGWDNPDPIKRPKDKIRIVQLPGTIIYVPAPQKPKRTKKKGRGGGGSVMGVE